MKNSGRKERAATVMTAQMSGISTGTKTRDNLPSGPDHVKAGFDLQNKTLEEARDLFSVMMLRDDKDPERVAFLVEWDFFIRRVVRTEKWAVVEAVMLSIMKAISGMCKAEKIIFLDGLNKV